MFLRNYYNKRTAIGLLIGSGVLSLGTWTQQRQKRMALMEEETSFYPASASSSPPPSPGGELRRMKTPITGINNNASVANPSTPKNIRNYPYIIMGSGTAAHAALEALRWGDPSAEILMIVEGKALPRFDQNYDEGGVNDDESGDDDENDAERKGNASSSSSQEYTENFEDYQKVDAAMAREEQKKSPPPSNREDENNNNNNNNNNGFGHFQRRLESIYNEWRRQLTTGLLESDEGIVTLMRSNGEDLKLDVQKKVITFPDNVEVSYEKCLLATAGSPRELYALDEEKVNLKERVNSLRDHNDFLKVVAALKKGMKNITVVGGGFLGTEIVDALSESEYCKTTHLMGEPTALSHYLPKYLSEHITEKLIQRGVIVRGETLVTGMKFNDDATSSENGNSEDNEKVSITLVGADRFVLDTDYVVLASTNVNPNLMGLDHPSTGLEISPDGGITTNASLEAYNGVFVAGNAASYYDSGIGIRRRFDMYDHAINSGMIAARNMMANPSNKEGILKYTHQPAFKSVLTCIGACLHGLGKIDSSLETVGVWFRPGFCTTSSSSSSVTSKPMLAKTSSDGANNNKPSFVENEGKFNRGIVYYLEKGKVVGVLLVNAGETLDQAREVLRKQKRINSDDDVTKLILLAPKHWLEVISTK